jgi:hypothetical protein
MMYVRRRRHALVILVFNRRLKRNGWDQSITSAGLNSRFTRGGTQRTKQKRRGTDVSRGGRGSGGGRGTADSAELRAHGYEVQ